MKKLVALLSLVSVFGIPLATSAQNPRQFGIDVRDVDIADAARLLSDATGRNIVLDGSVPRQKISVRFSADTPEKAINIFAKSEGLYVTYVDNAIVLIRESDVALTHSDLLRTQSFVIHNGSTSQIAAAIRQAFPRTSVSEDDKGRIILIRGSEADVRAASQSIAKLDSTSDGAGVRIVSISSQGKASDIAKIANASLFPNPGESVVANDQANQLTLTGGDGFISRASSFIQSYDHAGKQVEFNIRIVEYTPRNDTKDFGILLNGISFGSAQTAGGGQGGATVSAAGGRIVTSFLGTTLNVNATLGVLQQKDQATIISDPIISTLNNVPGTLDATEQYPIVTSNSSLGTVSTQVSYQPIGLKIVIVPTIGADGSVTSAVDAQYSGILGSVGGYPIIGNRHATTTRRVRPGETIVIAGLVQSADDHNVQSVPILSSLPLIGNFFKHSAETHTRSHLLFFITPHIVDELSQGFPDKSPGAEAAAAAKVQPGSVKPQ